METHTTSGTRLGPLPIVIGVTGHRDLRSEDVPSLENIVDGILADLQDRYPHTPVQVLSPLAEGADRLVARAALKRGLGLVVPLPMRRALYEEDFESRESRAEFAALLEQAYAVFEIPHREGVSDEDIHAGGTARDHQYGRLGAYIVRNSHALIALWDGILPERSNGTADVVGFNLNGIPDEFAPERNLLEPIESNPVWHVVTPRAGNPTGTLESPTLRMIHPLHYETEGEARRKFGGILENTERFNRDALAYGDQLADKRERSREYLIGPRGPLANDPALSPTIDLFAAADCMAGYFARHTHSTLKVLVVAAAAAAVIFDIYTHIHITVWPLLAGYLTMLVLIYALVIRSRRNSYQSRYLDYRALAEGLRVRLFWRLAGIEDEIADHYLHKQRSELDWIRYALRVWNPEVSAGTQSTQEIEPDGRLREVLKYWVQDQQLYFSRAARKEEGSLRRAERWTGVMVIAGIVLALFQVVQQGIVNPYPGKQPIHWLLVAVALAPIFGGLLLGYVEKRAHGDHAKQYERMSVLFANAKENLERLLARNDLDRARRLITDLGREALAENGDWVLTHRDRPIEVPKA